MHGGDRYEHDDKKNWNAKIRIILIRCSRKEKNDYFTFHDDEFKFCLMEFYLERTHSSPKMGKGNCTLKESFLIFVK